MVLLFGDTNFPDGCCVGSGEIAHSCLSCGSGNRFGMLDGPEEVNRTVTDHLSAINLLYTKSSLRFLEREGLGATSTVVGDPLYDAFCYYTEQLDGSELTDVKDFDGNVVVLPEEFYCMTCYR